MSKPSAATPILLALDDKAKPFQIGTRQEKDGVSYFTMGELPTGRRELMVALSFLRDMGVDPEECAPQVIPDGD